VGLGESGGGFISSRLTDTRKEGVSKEARAGFLGGGGTRSGQNRERKRKRPTEVISLRNGSYSKTGRVLLCEKEGMRLRGEAAADDTIEKLENRSGRGGPWKRGKGGGGSTCQYA